MIPRFEVHAHSDYSNIRLLDCINKIPKLIQYAQEIGLSGICLTDHESLCGHPEANIIAQDLLKKGSNFKIGLGNEIYLCKDRQSKQKYYHFILIAKNKTGQRALRELSSKAWLNSFFDRRLERTVTTYQDLKDIVNKYPNSLIATTACLGGELSTATLNMEKAEQLCDLNTREIEHDHIVNFIQWCLSLFKDDFYIECAPGQSKEQVIVNKRLASISKCFKVPMVIGTDAHYLKKSDRYVHKAYLNSKDGDREVDDFYEYAYLQNEDEIFENLSMSFEKDFIVQMFKNSMDIYDKIENYSLYHKQQIPKVKVKEYPKNNFFEQDKDKYPTLYEMTQSDDIVNRYWINECVNKLKEKNLFSEKYLNRLEEEADTKKTISEKLETNMFSYPVTLQHYTDMFWECGSIVGAGRGSSCAGLNHYLLGITQLNPIQWNLPFYRYLNKERVELGSL